MQPSKGLGDHEKLKVDAENDKALNVKLYHYQDTSSFTQRYRNKIISEGAKEDSNLLIQFSQCARHTKHVKYICPQMEFFKM